MIIISVIIFRPILTKIKIVSGFVLAGQLAKMRQTIY